MSLFNFNQDEILSFFAVLIRFSVLIAVLPFVGDRMVPAPVKVLLALAITIALFPAMVLQGQIQPPQAAVWGATAGGIVGTIALEVIFGLILGFTARMAFEAITFGGNLVGSFMGLAAASTYDPHQETQTQVIAQIQVAFAMLIFLAIDGHHVMLRASFDSYKVVGIGGASAFSIAGKSGATAILSQRLVELSSQVITFGIQLAAPVAVSLFAVNIAFGLMSRAMPQMNVLVLSFAVSLLVGLTVMFLSLGEFSGVAQNIFSRMDEWMEGMMLAVTGR